jgi:hypothetical protein
MHRSTTSPDEFLDSLPAEHQSDMRRLDAAISEAMAGLDRVLWEGAFWGGTYQRIIGYGGYTQSYRSGKTVDWFIVGLARQKRFYSLYVSAVEDDRYLVESMGRELGNVNAGKGSVRFSTADDLDMDAVNRLVTRAREIMTQ